MIKPVKRNKRLKWIDSHYARFYKSGLFYKRVQVVRVLAQGIAQQKMIRESFRAVGKKTAITKTVISTMTAVNKILEQPVKGRVTK